MGSKAFKVGTKLVYFGLLLCCLIAMFFNEDLAYIFLFAFSILRGGELGVVSFKDGNKPLAISFFILAVLCAIFFYILLSGKLNG